MSFDTGPERANWKLLFRDFKKRYPKIELTYNDIGSAATVIALENTQRRPQADTAYYFADPAVDTVKKGGVARLKPVNFDKLPAVFKEADGADSPSTHQHRFSGQQEAGQKQADGLSQTAQA